MDGKTFLKNYCTIHEHENSNVDVYFLHGFFGDREDSMNFLKHFHDNGYTVIACDARGHGDRYGESSMLDWMGTINDYDNALNERKRPSIISGLSMGGTQVISLGSINPHVKKVFALSALHDVKNTRLFDQRHSIIDSLIDSLPINHAKCDPENDEKFFLIHAFNDTIVPIDHFEKNKELLCISDDNTFVPRTIPFREFPHSMVAYRDETFEFIDEKILKGNKSKR